MGAEWKRLINKGKYKGCYFPWYNDLKNVMPRSSDHKLIKYHLKSRTRSKNDRANKAEGELKGRIAWEMVFFDWNTAIKVRMKCVLKLR